MRMNEKEWTLMMREKVERETWRGSSTGRQVQKGESIQKSDRKRKKEKDITIFYYFYYSSS